jgi:Xaa-Pro aminopeptidase
MQPLHGLGVNMAEGAPSVFREGNVVCYEPGLIAGGQMSFVEDTIVITRNGRAISSGPWRSRGRQARFSNSRAPVGFSRI